MQLSSAIVPRTCLSPEECLRYVQGEGSAVDDDAVQTHIDACAHCRVLLAEAARALAALGSEGVPDIASIRTLAVGEVLCDRYEIRGFVARGGMGEVYEAFDRVLGEDVALKTLAIVTVDRPDAAERFMAEVRLARKVTHANVCRILELGVHRQPRGVGGAAAETVPFFTMELLIGETLAQRLVRAGRMDPAEAMTILRDVSAGLTAVHEAGIVHRDFKSDNVFLVSREAGAARAVVMDFGLARATPALAAGRSSRRTLVGTADYMAPEQVEGRGATRASDIYALGVVAFEMITGQLPFSGDTPMATAVARLYREAATPSALRHELDGIWDRVIARCLARDPVRRFPRIEDPVAALERGLRARRRWRPTHLAVGAAIAIAAVSAGAASVMRGADSGSAPRGPQPAVASPAPARPAPAAPEAPAPIATASITVAPPPAPAPSPRVRTARASPVRAPAKKAAPVPVSPAATDIDALGDDDFISPYDAR